MESLSSSDFVWLQCVRAWTFGSCRRMENVFSWIACAHMERQHFQIESLVFIILQVHSLSKS